MADDTQAPDATTDVPPSTPPPDDSGDTPDDVEKWKALSRKNEKAAKDAQRELDKIRAASMSDTEKAVAEARAEGRKEALQESSRRLLLAEVRAAAAGVLADPDDAVHLLDLEPFETDGDIDRKAIRRALDELVKAKPYLSPQPGNGSGEGGPRGNPLNLPLGSDPLEETLRRKLGIT